MWHAVLVVACAFVLSASHAFALSSISLTADSISYDQAILTDAKVTLDLSGNDKAVVDAKTLTYGNTRLDNAHILLDLKADTTLLINASQISSDKFEARKPTIYIDYRKLNPQPSISFHAEIKPLLDKQWGDLNLYCLIPPNKQQDIWHCSDGLYAGEHANVPFSIDFVPQKNGKETNGLEANIQFKDVKFSDASGLHAGEKLAGTLKLSAQKVNAKWLWQGLIDWQAGELFWQPFYFGQAGSQFNISGSYAAPMLAIDQANLTINGVGKLSASAEMNVQTKAFNSIKVDAHNVDFNGLYQTFIQPIAAKSVFGNLKVSGRADWKIHVKDLRPLNFELNIENANIEDLNGKFGFSNVNAHIPWDYDVPKNIFLAYEKGHLLNMPLGVTHLQAEVNRYSITTPSLRLPILDGALQFEDVSAAWVNHGMVWHLQMALQPISMNSFSKALKWPEMTGQIDGNIPLITYANQQLNMDGQMQFNMFKGMVAMSGLRIDDPLGVAPKLYANLKMRDIDLGDLTRTFNFGSIEGKLEGDVANLKLENWKPVSMKAIIQTADGKHLKKISQRAVENITALGGEGTAAALQRTFLRFFKEFNYEKIGLSCELRQDICKMGGVESTPTGFIIVKGRGVPSVNVNGFTQYVSWQDLLARMKRITDGNTKVIVN
ncbi:MAG TPA: hypothetical protein VGD04_04925 [Methylophilus sp.]